MINTFQKNNGLVADGIVGKNTILKIKEVYDLDIFETSHFLAQIDHETGGFKYHTENLNYSAKGLLKIFKKYFTKEQAEKYARKPEKIANRVYANRMGNGDEASGDGWKYRGRSALQITGYNNYKSFSNYLKDYKVLTQPDIVATKYYLEGAIWYFEKHSIFDITKDIKESTIRKVTKIINGGNNGINHRIELTKKYYNLLREYEEDNKLDNSSTDSSDSNILVNEPTKRLEDKGSSEKREYSKNKTGFFAKIIRFIISAFSSRYSFREAN